MSVEQGLYGQKFIESTYDRIIELKEIIKQQKSKTLIQLDGGVGESNYKKLIDSGADILVIGNDYFKQKDYNQYVKMIKSYEKK